MPFSLTKPNRSDNTRRTALIVVALLTLSTGVGAFLTSNQGRAVARRLTKAAGRPFVGTAAQAAISESATEPLVLFAEDLGVGWQDWSWAERDLKSENQAKNGRRAIAMTVDGYKGVYLHHDAFDVSGYGSLEFWVRAPDLAASAKMLLTVAVADGAGKFQRQSPVSFAGSAWTKITVPFTDLDVAKTGNRIAGIVIQDAAGSRQGTIFLDDIRLLPRQTLPNQATAPTASASVTIPVLVDVSAGRHPISPLIYGLAHLPAGEAAEWGPGADRWGGNGNSRYNWMINAGNAARTGSFVTEARARRNRARKWMHSFASTNPSARQPS